jgi:hypothetical protein
MFLALLALVLLSKHLRNFKIMYFLFVKHFNLYRYLHNQVSIYASAFWLAYISQPMEYTTGRILQ